MADEEDPYALSSDSSDSEDSEARRRPPPKIEIAGRSNADFQQIKQSLTAEKKDTVRDEKTLEEIAELKRAKADDLRKFKRDFEAGAVHNTTVAAAGGEGDASSSSGAMPAGELTGLDKKTLTAFKAKFEKMDATLDMSAEERIRSAEKSLEGVGKENLASMKDMFEKQPAKEFTKSAVASEEELLGLLQRSDADKKRLRAAFDNSGASEPAAEPTDCCICGKIVYPVEKIVASKRLYHTGCFKCATCGKKLSSTTFNSHKGALYCRPHMLEVLHPERAGTTGGGGGDGSAAAEDDEGEPIHVDDDDDDDDEFAVSSKPKHHGANVVRAGNSSIGDELSQLKSSLKDKKQNWQQSVSDAAAAAATQQKSAAPADEIAAGRVKANLDKFISGAGNDNEEENNEEEEEKRRQLDAIRNQVSEVKNKWKTGDLEKAETHADRATDEELAQLKKGPKVRERFSERLEPADGAADDDAAGGGVVKSYDRSELDTSNASEARKSFLEGLAYQSGPVEKSSASELQDLKFEGLRSFKDKFEKGEEGRESSREKATLELDIQLKAIKQALEKGTENLSDMSPEARAERKKQEIEAEFLRYKLARKIQAKRQAEQAAAAGEPQGEASDSKEAIPTSAEVGSIKNRFDTGEAYKSDTTKTGVDVDIKMAGKAREKFKNIDAQNPGSAPTPTSKNESKPSKWDKKTESNAEVVNKRTVADVESSDEDDNFDVKNLMNKFKNIENIAPNKVERKLDELEALRVEAKNLRQRFEQAATGGGGGAADGDDDESEERRRQLEEEFRQLKEERERAQKALDEERLAAQAAAEEENAQKDDVQIAEGHGSKMAAKWEKIQKKEAKKAQKSQMPQKAAKAADNSP